MIKRRSFIQAIGVGGTAALTAPNRVLGDLYAGLGKISRDVNALTLEGRQQTLPRGAVQDLAAALRGQLLLPGNSAYEMARQVLNPEIDKHPALVVQPSGAADVCSAIQFAAANNLEVAVKCGGHSFSGKSTCDGGMLVDLSSLRHVRVDPKTQRAFVAGGCLLGQMDHETMAHGLVTTAGTVSHTGVGGLATGGGFGRLGRRFGLALDNITGLELVAADGRLYHASAQENPDLYWGVRGGGGNFGVVTSFEFALHPMQRQVMGGALLFPLSKMRHLMELYAEYSPLAPDDLYTDFLAVCPPGDAASFAMLEICYSGPRDSYERLIKPYSRLNPVANNVAPIDYVALQRSSDRSDPRANASYVKGGFVSALSQGLIDRAVQGLQKDPRRSTMLYFQHAGGAIGRVAEDATAFAHRYATHNMLPMVDWVAGTPRADHVEYLKQYWSDLEPFSHGFYTVEIDDQTEPVVSRNYQGNYTRLVAVKNRYDPENRFRLNANVAPTA